MWRIKKERLSASDLDSLQKINPSIQLDLESDHCADRVYSFSIAGSLSEDLIRVFDFFLYSKISFEPCITPYCTRGGRARES